MAAKSEKRNNKRYTIKFSTDLISKINYELITSLVDMSVSGLAFRINPILVKLEKDQKISLHFNSAEENLDFAVDARVIWRKDDLVGVEFEDINAETTQSIKMLIEKYHKKIYSQKWER